MEGRKTNGPTKKQDPTLHSQEGEWDASQVPKSSDQHILEKREGFRINPKERFTLSRSRGGKEKVIPDTGIFSGKRD